VCNLFIKSVDKKYQNYLHDVNKAICLDHSSVQWFVPTVSFLCLWANVYLWEYHWQR